MTFTKTVVMLMRYFEEDEDFMDMAGFLPEYIDHAAMRKEAVKAGAKPDWLDPNGSHARVHKMIKEKMSEAEAAKRARRANGEESDDDDDEDDDGDQGNDDDDDEEDGVLQGHLSLLSARRSMPCWTNAVEGGCHRRP